MRWLTPPRAVVLLLILTLIAGGGNLAASFAEVHHANMVQQQQDAARQRQGAMIEAKLCTTLEKLGAQTPPSGPPATNPSRAYLQDLSARFRDIARDLGCIPGGSP